MDNGATELRVSLFDHSDIKTWEMSPKRLGIDVKVQGYELIFSISKPQYFIFRINGLKEFIVLIDPMEAGVPTLGANGVYNVLDYGADKTGKTLNSGLQDAVDAAAKNPGSTVYVPPGLYLLGNLMLRSKTNLYLAGGAVLRFTGNASDYKKLFDKDSIGPGTWWIQTEFGSTDIKVYGRGTIDGNGKATRNNKFMASLLVPVGTKNFVSDGLLFRDGGYWTVTPIQTEDVVLSNIKILNRHDITENDGIDVIESSRVKIDRGIAIAHDDSFSTKTWPKDVGTTKPYPYDPRPQNDVVFNDCLAWTGCYGYKVGQGVWEDQDNITFQNSVVYTAAVGLGIDHKFGTATARNIRFENMDFEKQYSNSWGKATWLAVFSEDEGSGVGPIEDITIKNIRVRKYGDGHAFLEGFNAASMVKRVTLSNIYIYDNSTPATTLNDMKIWNTAFSEGIKIVNS